MPSPIINRAIAGGARRVPVLRRLPMLKLLAVADVVLLAHHHMVKLEPHERRRLVTLGRLARGRRRNLTPAERDELSLLVAKAEPRLFVGVAANKHSPV